MTAKKQSSLSFIFGLASLVLCWYFWYPVWGIVLTVFTFAFGVMAILWGKKFIRNHKLQPDWQKTTALRNAKFGYVMGWIGVLLSFICFLLALLFSLYFHFLN